MKKRIIISLLGLLICLGCSRSSDEPDAGEEPPVKIENRAPSVPELKLPEDELNCTENQLAFSWSASVDPEGDKISYYIQLATNHSFTENLQVLTTSDLSSNFSVLKGYSYYWRLRAKDDNNNTSEYSSVRVFYSAQDGVTNQLPYVAKLLAPAIDSFIAANVVTLKWEGSDADNEVLKYDLYFGETNPPAIKAENMSQTSFDINLKGGTIYYWRVDSRDDSGGEALGQVWTFSTE